MFWFCDLNHCNNWKNLVKNNMIVLKYFLTSKFKIANILIDDTYKENKFIMYFKYFFNNNFTFINNMCKINFV